MTLAPLAFRCRVLDWSRSYVVGILNVTPDSFSDGGRHDALEAAVERGLALVASGADLLDIGGESTRPGASPVPLAEELERVVPVIERLAGCAGVPISVDTCKAGVAQAAVAAGAELVNDISGGCFDPALIDAVAATGAAFVCGHVRGRSLAEVHAAQAVPLGWQEVAEELAQRLARLPAPVRGRTIVDPGLGFGKGTACNLALGRHAGDLARQVSCPVMVGPSRKRFLGELTGLPVGERDAATVGAALAAVACGAHLVRVHEVGAMVQALRVFEAVMGSRA